MKKILVIAQAPPSPTVIQKYPMDTTMWPEWLKECNITLEQAQEMFEFEAMTDKFPGHGKSGHKVPGIEEMQTYYTQVLLRKIREFDRVILLGNVPKDFFNTYHTVLNDKPKTAILCLIHPSRRNYDRYMQNKEQIINSLKEFINK